MFATFRPAPAGAGADCPSPRRPVPLEYAMRARRIKPACLLTVLACTLASGLADNASAQGFLRRFVPVKRVEAKADADYSLTQQSGPWMIMACTFSGDGAEQQARELALEFRQRYNLPAYTHGMNFKFDDTNLGRGLDEYGAPVQMKYRNGNTTQQWAVLVGDFPSIDDPEAQKLLKTVKTLKPNSLVPDGKRETAQSFARIRQAQAKFVPRLGNSKELGPMRTAFMARNPILPKEYFVPKGVDKFVEKLNQHTDYSLLDCKGKFTVKVATFNGQVELQGAANRPKSSRRGKDISALEQAALDAELLVKAMRAANIEAYSFHDREESYVAVGSFDRATVRQLDGSQGPVPEIARILRTFGAQFDTPTDPLQQATLPLEVHAAAEQKLYEFNHVFARQNRGQQTSGMHPKFARWPPKSKDARVIPFDIYPEVIEVPKKTISAGFAWGR